MLRYVAVARIPLSDLLQMQRSYYILPCLDRGKSFHELSPPRCKCLGFSWKNIDQILTISSLKASKSTHSFRSLSKLQRWRQITFFGKYMSDRNSPSLSEDIHVSNLPFKSLQILVQFLWELSLELKVIDVFSVSAFVMRLWQKW